MPTPPNASVQVIPFVAESAADAVAQIRAKLGPEAVVVNVRQLPADGLAKLWKSPRIEVLAYKPDAKAAAEIGVADPLAELKQELQAIRQQLGPATTGHGQAFSLSGAQDGLAAGTLRGGARRAGTPGWRIGEVLETSGLMPVHAQQVVDQLQSSHGEVPPGTLAEEVVLARAALSGLWRQTPDKS